MFKYHPASSIALSIQGNRKFGLINGKDIADHTLPCHELILESRAAVELLETVCEAPKR